MSARPSDWLKTEFRRARFESNRTVFVLTENERGEGGTVRGVFGTLEDAQAMRSGAWVTYGDGWRLDENNGVDYLMIETFEARSGVAG